MVDLEQLAAHLQSLDASGRAEFFNAQLRGHDAALGLQFASIEDARVVATLVITEAHTQPYGLVHGGVHAALVESVCSVGAALSVMPDGNNAVGAENTTRFLRPARPGTTLTATATPGKSSPDGRRLTWEAVITDDTGERCAVGSVTVAVLPPSKKMAGSALGLD